MAAPFLPPPNFAGVALPPLPQNPVVFADIAPVVDYTCQLNDGRIGETQATAHEVGLAELYKAALIISDTPPGNMPVAPPWLHAIQANANTQFAIINTLLINIANDVTAIRREQPILLANSQAGTCGPLYDPTDPGWVLLAPPNPTTRDQLLLFTQQQCIASAGVLGLPALPPNTPIDVRRRQIASKLGVAL